MVLLKRIMIVICMVFLSTGVVSAQGSRPRTADTTLNDTYLYNSSLAFSPNMQFAVATQEPHKSVYVYSLKGKGKNIAVINGFVAPRTVLFDATIPNRFYVADSMRGAIFIVDIIEETYKIVKSINVEKGIFGMVLDPRRKRLYVTNPATGRLHIVDLQKDSVILSKPGFLGVQQGIALNPAGTILYLGSQTAKELYALDTRTLAILERIEGVQGVSSLALNNSGARLFVASLSNNMIFVYSTATHKLLASIPTGTAPMAIAIPKNNTAIVTSNIKDGTLSVISSLHMNVVRTIKLPSMVTGAIVASKNSSKEDIVYALDRAMNILVVNWPMGLVQSVIE